MEFIQSRAVRITAILAASLVSISTTAKGFALYLGGAATYGWFIAIAVQVIILILMRILLTSPRLVPRLVAAVLMVAPILSSAVGSFLQFDFYLTVADRKVRADQDDIEAVQGYQLAALSVVQERKTAAAASSAQIEAMLGAEERIGAFSRNKQGKGAMYEELNIQKGKIDAYTSALNAADGVIATACRANCATDDAECYRQAFAPCADALARLPADAQLLESSASINAFASKSAYAIPSTATAGVLTQAPAAIELKSSQQDSLPARILGAYQDVREGVASTWMALLLAFFVEGIVIALMFADHYFGKVEDGDSTEQIDYDKVIPMR